MTHPMDDLLAQLEAAERSTPVPTAETSERVWAAVESRLSDGPPPPPLDEAPLFPPGASGVGLTLLKIVGGLAVLGAIGLGASALWPAGGMPEPDAPEPLPPVAVAEPAPIPEAPHAPASEPVVVPETILEPAPEPADEPAPEVAQEPEPAPKTPARPGPSKTKAEAPKTLADELALMQSITASLKANDASTTLRLVREHERDFPTGQFVEERRAAKARGLCRKGKASAGRKEADRFEKRWPKSIHLSAVREDCGLD